MESTVPFTNPPKIDGNWTKPFVYHIQGDQSVFFLLPISPGSYSCSFLLVRRVTTNEHHCPMGSCNVLQCCQVQSGAKKKKNIFSTEKVLCVALCSSFNVKMSSSSDKNCSIQASFFLADARLTFTSCTFSSTSFGAFKGSW